jgi:hypothetical protein
MGEQDGYSKWICLKRKEMMILRMCVRVCMIYGGETSKGVDWDLGCSIVVEMQNPETEISPGGQKWRQFLLHMHVVRMYVRQALHMDGWMYV